MLAAALAALAHGGEAAALGRTPLGGKLAFKVPWSLASLDPHDAFDPAAALFGSAVFDTLVVPDPRAGVRAGLADALPTREAGVTTVKLRHGVRTSRGALLDAGDVLASLKRARARGAAPLLEPLGDMARVPSDPFALQFPKATVAAVTRAVTSPLTAIVSRAFDPRAPDGTGALAPTLRGGALELVRNPLAANGAAFLERVVVGSASDLRESLRDFEAERDDVGWLGSGVFGSRKGAVKFDLGAVALIALAGPRDGARGKPGALQRLVDGVPRGKLAHLGIGALPGGTDGTAWDGGNVDLWVDAGAAHLVAVAEALSDALSRPDDAITVRKGSRDEVMAKRRRGDVLSLHVVRSVGPGAFGAMVGLAELEDPARAKELAKAGPRLAEGRAPRDLARELRVAVVGEVRVAGAVVPGFVLAPLAGGGWDLGATHLARG
jgi:peptide/nickel transport system substrate-binding protein